MSSAAERLPPGSKAALVIGSAILHLAVFGLIWMLLPTAEKAVGPSPERIAIPEELVESVRRDVEQRQLEELKIKLSELQNLQTAISDIRESRLVRWERLSAALEEFAPEAASIIAVSAAEAVNSLREFLAGEGGIWETYRQAAASPEGGLTAKEGTRPAAMLASIYESARLQLAALREQQRLLREKLALGGANASTQASTQALAELENRVSAAVESIDSVQAGRSAHERAYNEHRSALGRISGIQLNQESALESFQKSKTALTDTKIALAKAEEDESAAEKAAAAADPSDRRAHQEASKALKKVKDLVSSKERELKQREDSVKKSQTQLASREEALQAAQTALRESERNLPETFQELEKTRKSFLSELTALLNEQEKINQSAGAGS